MGICRRLVDVFEHTAVDLIGNDVRSHPELDRIVDYCEAIGLAATPCNADACDTRRWEPAGTRWSLDAEQKRADRQLLEPLDIFGQIRVLRGDRDDESISSVQRAINQLTVRVPETGCHRRVVWLYGSPQVGLELIGAIERHVWLTGAIEVGGFLSSPGHCKADSLHGYSWRSLDTLGPCAVDLIVVASEASRLPIQEELNRAGLLDRMVPMYGLAARSRAHSYERIPGGPGQAFVEGFTAYDYAASELLARTAAPAGALAVSTRPAAAA